MNNLPDTTLTISKETLEKLRRIKGYRQYNSGKTLKQKEVLDELLGEELERIEKIRNQKEIELFAGEDIETKLLELWESQKNDPETQHTMKFNGIRIITFTEIRGEDKE